MRCKSCLIVITLAASIAGCSPPALSVHPLYTSTDDDKIISEPRIEGEWISLQPGLEDVGTDRELWLRVHVEARGGGRYSVEVRPVDLKGWDGIEVMRYNVALVSLNDRLFFDGTIEQAQSGERTTGLGSYFGLVPAHIVGRIWVEDGFLRVTMPSSKSAEDNTKEAIRLFDDDASVITASTGDLRRFMELNADDDDASTPPTYLCRPRTDCASRAFEDVIARNPDDSALANDVAAFYLTRGNYQRSVELRRRCVERGPNNAEYKSTLGEALMFQRDFEGARKEFTAARQLDRTVASPKDGITWTYFLEGRFAEAAVASNPASPDDRLSVDAILLHYFSLERLASPAQASAFLSEQAVRFTGSREEHVLLAEMQGRVPESLSEQWKYPAGEAERRFLFYSALRALAAGDTQLARNRLANVIADVPNDSRIGLAAKIELERLAGRREKGEGERE